MDVRLSAEQEALRHSAAQVVDRLGPKAVPDLDDAGRVAKLERAVEEAGWREIRVAAEGTAPLASAVEAAIIAEELGRGLVDVPFLGPTLAAELRRLAGAPPATVVEAVAFAPDLSGPAIAAGGVVPDGSVAVDSGRAATALMLFDHDGGFGLAEVELAPGGGGGVDLSRSVTPVLPGQTAAVLAGSWSALTPEQLRSWSALGLALTCADLVGVMIGAVHLATDYASTRRQFGVAVGSFQAVQHMLADAAVAMEGSRSVALHAAWAVDALTVDEALAAAALAKVYCARAARTVCETGIQVHGGIGNTWDCLAHVYLRRSVLSGDVLGGVGPNLVHVLAHRGIGGADGLR